MLRMEKRQQCNGGQVTDKYFPGPRAGLGIQTEENKRRLPPAIGVFATHEIIVLAELLTQAGACPLSESLHQPLIWREGKNSFGHN